MWSWGKGRPVLVSVAVRHLSRAPRRGPALFVKRKGINVCAMCSLGLRSEIKDPDDLKYVSDEAKGKGGIE